MYNSVCPWCKRSLVGYLPQQLISHLDAHLEEIKASGIGVAHEEPDEAQLEIGCENLAPKSEPDQEC